MVASNTPTIPVTPIPVTPIPLTPDRIVYDLKSASQPDLSPDATQVVYIVSGNNRETKKAFSQVWITTLASGEARQLTRSDGAHSSPVWSPDGRTIAFVAGRGDGRHGIFVLPLDGGEAREITDHLGGPSELAWSPDGKAIAYIVAIDPANPDEQAPDKEALPPIRVVTRSDYKLDGRGYLGDTHTQVFVVDVATGTKQQLTADPVDHLEPQWSSDGVTLGTLCFDRTHFRSKLALLDLSDDEPNIRMLLGEDHESVHGWTWSPDGTSILAHLSRHYSVGGAFFLFDHATGTRRPVGAEFSFATEYGGSVAWTEESVAIIGGSERSACGLWSLNVGSGEFTRLTISDSYEAGVEMVAGSRIVVRTGSRDGMTGELIVHDLSAQTSSQLTHLNDAYLTATPMGSVERLSTINEGLEIESLLTKPADFDPAKRYPVVVFVHGGPHMFQTFGHVDMNQLLASQGYIVVSPNPRGSISYGTEFALGCLGDWGGGDWRDIVAALDAVLELPYVDRERTGIYGYSYGGYMSSWAIGQTDRFKAAVIGAPITDLISRYGTSDIGYAIGNEEYAGEVPDLFDLLVERSPMTHVHKAVTPSLILHPEEDHRCPIGQGEQLFTGLLKAAVPTEFVRYPGQSHIMPWTGPAEYRVDFNTRVLAWFEKYL